MKRYTVSRARESLADVLDHADRHGAVVIERRDVQYVIRPRKRAGRERPTRSVIEIVDPAVADGQWTWDWTAKGLGFRRRRR